jgi:predicted RND superfamily exporter protein
MKKLNIDKSTIILIVTGFIVGVIATFLFTRSQIQYQKNLTKRILNNSVQSMQATKQIADTCTQAYNTATACVSNLNTCDIEAEAKKLDQFNYKRGQAEEIIDWMGDDMEKIIEEVKASQ